MTQIIFSQFTAGLVLLGVIQFLFSIWIKARLEKSIQHEYDRLLEEYRFDQAVRHKAEATAKLFSKWIKYRGKEESFLNDNELINYYEELNQMIFEICYWIKDEKLLSNIMLRLQNHGNARPTLDLITDLRKTILNNKDDGFLPTEITIFPNPGSQLSQRLFKN